jgi:hypothetical protein
VGFFEWVGFFRSLWGFTRLNQTDSYSANQDSSVVALGSVKCAVLRIATLERVLSIDAAPVAALANSGQPQPPQQQPSSAVSFADLQSDMSHLFL